MRVDSYGSVDTTYNGAAKSDGKASGIGVTYEAWLVTYCWKVPGHWDSVSKSFPAPGDWIDTDIVSGDLLIEADGVMSRQTSRYKSVLSEWGKTPQHAKMCELTAATTDGRKPFDAYSVANTHCRVRRARAHLDNNANAFMATNLITRKSAKPILPLTS